MGTETVNVLPKAEVDELRLPSHAADSEDGKDLGLMKRGERFSPLS